MKYLLTYCLWIFGISTFAQEVKSSVSSEQFMIGERVKYSIEFKLKSKNDSVEYKEYSTLIPARQKLKNSVLSNKTESTFEIFDGFKDTILSDQNIWRGTYEITCWDTGYFMIPQGTLTYRDSSYEIPPVLLHVTMYDHNPNIDPLEVREVFEDIPEEPFLQKVKRISMENWYWIALIILIVLLIFIRRRWKKSALPPKIHKELSLKDRALFAIESLEKRKMWEENKLKAHYSELSNILRMYLSGRYKQNFLEKTTSESCAALLKIGLEKEIVDSIRFILSHADMVKFANSEPSEMEILKVSVLAKQVVAETSPIEFENE